MIITLEDIAQIMFSCTLVQKKNNEPIYEVPFAGEWID